MPKHGRSQWTVNLFGIHVSQLAVEDEIIALGSKTHGRFLAEKDEGKDIAILPASDRLLVHCPPFFGLVEKQRRTCSRHRKKNLYGSMPYVIVLPKNGTQWKTRGGSSLLRRTS